MFAQETFLSFYRKIKKKEKIPLRNLRRTFSICFEKETLDFDFFISVSRNSVIKIKTILTNPVNSHISFYL